MDREIVFGVGLVAIIVLFVFSRRRRRHQRFERALARLDWDVLKTRLRARHKWTPQRADQALAQYRVLLRLVDTHPRKMFAPLSRDCDLAWHEHILDTRMYARDCRRLFGRSFSHQPSASGGEAWLATARGNTRHDLARLRGADDDLAAAGLGALAVAGIVAIEGGGVETATEAALLEPDATGRRGGGGGGGGGGGRGGFSFESGAGMLSASSDDDGGSNDSSSDSGDSGGDSGGCGGGCGGGD